MTAAAFVADVGVVSAQLANVIAIAGVLAVVVRLRAPAIQYQYWRALLVLSAILPWLQPRRPTASAVESLVTTVWPTIAVAVAPPAALASSRHGMSWVHAATWLIVAGIVLRLGRIGVGMIRLSRFRRSGRQAPEIAEHDDLQRALGVRADIRFVRDGQPVTCGVWRPVVLLPEGLRSHPAEIQRAVLAHELLHVKRRDWIWVIAEEVLRSVFWFHPGVWWLVARVRLAREEAVDELTVRATGQRRAYLEALLAFADAAPFAPSPAFARDRHLFRRMTLISKETVMSSTRIVVSCAVLVFGVVAGSWYSVKAFPLAQSRGAISAPPSSSAAGREVGPLEQNAKPITPENPIPRRTYSVTPQYPAGIENGSAAVYLRVTINSSGQVGEVRAVGRFAGNVVMRDGQIYANSVQTYGAGVLPSDIFVTAAVDAVRQWMYEPPVNAPMTFDVSFLFAPGAETRLIGHGTALRQPASMSTTDFLASQPPSTGLPSWTRDGYRFSGVGRVGGDVKPPVRVKDVKAVYPEVAKAAGVQGLIIIELIVGPDGQVDQVNVLRSVPELDQAAIDAARQWEFTPAMRNGVPVPVLVTATIEFSLK